MRADPIDELFIRTVASRIKKTDFAFTVQAVGTPWDVYHVAIKGRPGMIALRLIEGRAEIGFFQAGKSSPEAVVRALEENAPS